MHSAALLSSGPSSYGAMRMLAPFPEVQNFSSYIHEMYRNIPQMDRSVVLSVPPHYNYKSFSPRQNHYRGNYPASLYPSKLQVNKEFNYMLYPQRRGDDETANAIPSVIPSSITPQSREDAEKGHGWKDAGHHQKNSPALSALALLGFMFYLNLIQTSLQNNRAMLTGGGGTVNATRVGLIAGRMREKRAIPLQLDPNDAQLLSPNNTPQHSFENTTMAQKFYSTNVPRRGLSSQSNHTNRRENAYQNTTKEQRYYAQRNLINRNTIVKNLKLENNFTSEIETLLMPVSVHCLELFACKLAKYLFRDVDSATGTILHELGKRLSTMNSTSKASRMINAVCQGWANKTCENFYYECTLSERV